MSRHRISAGALVEHGGKLLLVRHVRPGRYDFWVAPGGGVRHDESYEEAALREVREETGLVVDIGPLRYVEDLVNPECRFVKFWFQAQLIGGELDVSHPEVRAELITDAAFLHPADLVGRTVFPELLLSRYASDEAAGFPDVVRLPMRRMAFW